MLIDGHVPLRTMRKAIEAAHYNRIRLARSRAQGPVEVELPALRLHFSLERHCWVARSLINDTPMLVWTAFRAHGRALHEPVSCELHLFHFHAGLLMGSAIGQLCAALGRPGDEGPLRLAPVHGL